MSDDPLGHDPLRLPFGFTLDGGDGPTIVRPRVVSARFLIQCGLGLLFVLGALFGTGVLSWDTLAKPGPVAVVAVFVLGTLALIWWRARRESQRGPLLVIDHAARLIRLPRSNAIIPFVVVRAIQRRYYMDELGESSVPHVELSVVIADGVAAEDCLPFLRGVCFSIFERVNRRDGATRLAARLAEELRVGVRDINDGAAPPHLGKP